MIQSIYDLFAKKHFIFLMLLFFVVCFLACGQVHVAFAADEDYVSNQIIIKYKDGYADTARSTISSLGVKEVQSISDKVKLIQVSTNQDMEKTLEQLQNNPDIEYAEPNYIVEAFGFKNMNKTANRAALNEANEPNDEYYSLQWGLNMIHASKGWDSISDNGSVVAAVIDTGVDAQHPDLQGRVLGGYNFIQEKSNGQAYNPTDATDDHGHGTHVSGIIAALCNNERGITGVVGNGEVDILPVKVLNDRGRGTSFDVAKGIRYAADQGADIINLSLGSSFRTQVEADAIAYAQDRGVVVIAAAGNESSRVEYTYPASFPGVIAVGAIDASQNRAYFSNYGETLDVVAPGVDILSCVPTWLGEKDKRFGEKVYGSSQNGYYEAWSGTSMATPHVVGVAALYKLAHPDASSLEITEVLIHTAADIGPIGKDNDTGYGLVDVAAVMEKSEPVRKSLAFLSPKENKSIYGTSTVKLQVGLPDQIKKIDLYLDGTDETCRLTSLSCQDTQILYDWEWDTTAELNGQKISDGQHTLYAKAMDQEENVIGSIESLSIYVKNEITHGLGLQVKDPLGNDAAYARVYVLNNQNGYQLMNDYYTNEQGYIRVPGLSNLGEKGYEIVVFGKFEQEGKADYFVYKRHYDQAGSYVIEGKNTARVDLQMEGINGNLSNPFIFVTPVDESNNRLNMIGPFEKEDHAAIYMDLGTYDFFGFWNPMLTSTKNTGEVQDEPIYFLNTREDIQNEKKIVLNTQNCGRITAEEDEGDNHLIVYLQNINEEEAFGIPFVKNNLKGKDLVVPAGEYKVNAEIENGSGDNWRYDLQREENITVTADVNTPMLLNFGGKIKIDAFESANGNTLKKGELLVTHNRFTDTYGNLLTKIYEPSPDLFTESGLLFMKKGQDTYHYALFDKSSFEKVDAQWIRSIDPTFAIYKGEEKIYSHQSSSSFTESKWDSARNYDGELPPDMGSYTAKLSVKGGPLSETEILEKSIDFDIVCEPGEEKMDVVIKGRDGVTPLGNTTVDIYKWEDDQWQSVQSFRADSNGLVGISKNMPLNKEGMNLAIIKSSVQDMIACTVKEFSDLSELETLDFSTTYPVDVLVYDKSGNKQSPSVTFPIMSDGKQQLTNSEFVTEVSLKIGQWNSKIYLDPGWYDYFYTSFNQGFGSYFLSKKDISIKKEPMLITLDGRNTAHIQVKTDEGYQLPKIYLHPKDMTVLHDAGIDTKYFDHLYLSSNDYSPEIVMKNTSDPKSTYRLGVGKSNTVVLQSKEEGIWQFGEPVAIEAEILKNPIAGHHLEGNILIVDRYGNRVVNIAQTNAAGEEISLKPSLNIYAQEDGKDILKWNGESKDYYNAIDLVLPTEFLPGTYRVEVMLQDIAGKMIKTDDTYPFEIVSNDGEEKGSYQVIPNEHPQYIYDKTSDGITRITIPQNISGFQSFQISIVPVTEHQGDETVVFTHLRDGVQVGLQAVQADFDHINSAEAAFNVKDGDEIKVYIVDDLNNDENFNPTILQ